MTSRAHVSSPQSRMTFCSKCYLACGSGSLVSSRSRCPQVTLSPGGLTTVGGSAPWMAASGCGHPPDRQGLPGNVTERPRLPCLRVALSPPPLVCLGCPCHHSGRELGCIFWRECQRTWGHILSTPPLLEVPRPRPLLAPGILPGSEQAQFTGVPARRPAHGLPGLSVSAHLPCCGPLPTALVRSL